MVRIHEGSKLKLFLFLGYRLAKIRETSTLCIIDMLELQQAIKDIELRNFLSAEDVAAIDRESENLDFLEGPHNSTFESSLCDKVHSYVCEHFDHVIGYHGCRCADERSYSLKGIMPSDRDREIKHAREIFKGLDVEKGLQNLGNGDPGTVGILFSPDTRSCYLGGSEFLRQVAGGIGTDEAQKRLKASGIPTLIRCKLPIDTKTTNKDKFNDPSVGFLYSYFLLRRLVATRTAEGYNFVGGVTILGGIPPSGILRIENALTMTAQN